MYGKSKLNEYERQKIVELRPILTIAQLAIRFRVTRKLITEVCAGVVGVAAPHGPQYPGQLQARGAIRITAVRP